MSPIERVTLVFDLDETLVSTISDRTKMKPNMDYNALIKIDEKEFFISFRPFMIEMLRKLHRHFELILFTAGYRVYADAVVRILQRAVLNCDKPKLFDHVLAREFCTLTTFRKKASQLYHYKDLRVLMDGRSLSEMVLIDNRALSFGTLHLTNGIPIKDYNGD